jgi:hypothetical protein
MKQYMWKARFLVFAGLSVLMLFNSSSTYGQSEGQAKQQIPDIKVKNVEGDLGLYRPINVEVENLSQYLEKTGKEYGKFTLYLDWRPLKGLTPRLAGNNKLTFDLRRTDQSKDEWDALLGRPFTPNKKGFKTAVPVTIGYDNENPIKTDVGLYSLIVVNKYGFLIAVVAFALSLYIFWSLARRTGILRDPCPDLPPPQRPYSLGRTQMAFWFFVVVAAYLLIWLITSNRDSLTQEVLTLLGISTATALGAAVVGANKASGDDSKKQALEQEQQTLAVRLSQLDQEIAAQPQNLTELNQEKADKTARLEQVKKELAAVNQRQQPQQSEGFLKDILSDADGVSLHRFQMAIWTIVLGIIFAASVYNSLAMPQFSGTQLALMGNSGGTYIGFKFPEKQT